MKKSSSGYGRPHLNDVIGSRGESIAELRLTDYQGFDMPLFIPGFLGDKWPAIDYYVELEAFDGRGKHLYFFVQVKSTSVALSPNSKHLSIFTKRKDIEPLLRIPGPTYILGVHEPSERVFVRSIHAGTALKAIQKISLAHELTATNLLRLHSEVRDFWESRDNKPLTSVFA